MPGAGKPTRGKGKYSGHLRPRHKLTQDEADGATLAKLRDWDDGLNDAYDFDAVDATDYHNATIVRIALEKRYREQALPRLVPTGPSMLPIFSFIRRLEGK